MHNLEITVRNNVLIVRVDLTKEVGLSKSGRSIVVGSSGGNLRLVDKKGRYRPERLNLVVTKSANQESDDY